MIFYLAVFFGLGAALAFYGAWLFMDPHERLTIAILNVSCVQFFICLAIVLWRWPWH